MGSESTQWTNTHTNKYTAVDCCFPFVFRFLFSNFSSCFFFVCYQMENNSALTVPCVRMVTDFRETFLIFFDSKTIYSLFFCECHTKDRIKRKIETICRILKLKSVKLKSFHSRARFFCVQFSHSTGWLAQVIDFNAGDSDDDDDDAPSKHTQIHLENYEPILMTWKDASPNSNIKWNQNQLH